MRPPGTGYVEFLAHETFDLWPKLSSRLSVVTLGQWPTRVERLAGLERAVGGPGALYVKRDDQSSPIYGGNKVRTLEVLFAAARRAGSTRVFATGAFGSNHAAATVLHAARAGLEPGAILYPQPACATVLDNLRVIVARAARFVALSHWSALPFGIFWTRHTEIRAGRRPFIMVPGGATREGALGYVGAALELAHQVARGEMPRPDRVVVPVGSICTTAGLLAGFSLAARLGIGFVKAGRPAPPELVAVRVTPRIVTSAWRIVRMAAGATRLLRTLAEDPSISVDESELRMRLRVEGRYLGRGYGHATPDGLAAIARFRETENLELDPIYSGKAGAGFLALAEKNSGVSLFWSTKSSAPLPDVALADDAHSAVRRFAERVEGAAR